MSRKANVLSDSKTFMEGISPAGLLVLYCASLASCIVPLMILQKIQLAAILIADIRVCTLMSCRRSLTGLSNVHFHMQDDEMPRL